jgi:hypothetical protein
MPSMAYPQLDRVVVQAYDCHGGQREGFGIVSVLHAFLDGAASAAGFALGFFGSKCLNFELHRIDRYWRKADVGLIGDARRI